MKEKGHNNIDIPIIGEMDIIPFGKYKGKVLRDVYKQNPSYVLWMIDNVSNYKIELYSGWKDILKGDDAAPIDGVYVIACRYDNHLGFEIYGLKKGYRFWKLYENENAHWDGYYPIDCLAYFIIPEYGPEQILWGDIITNRQSVSVFAVQKKDDIEYALSYQGWGMGKTFEELKEGVADSLRNDAVREIRDYSYTDAKMNVNGITKDSIKAGLNIPAYTEEMHCRHWQMIRNNNEEVIN